MMKRVPTSPKPQARIMPLSALALTLAAAMSAQSQSPAPQPASAAPFSYEVVSIKPHKGDRGPAWRSTGDSFLASDSLVTGLIMGAYDLVNPDQISGLPGWAASDAFDIVGKMDEQTAAAMHNLPINERKERQGAMLQALLADRFQLKVHYETRELPVYNLVIAKGGSKLKEAAAGERAWMSMSPTRLTATAFGMHELVYSLSNDVGRVVIDKTGLTGGYDFTLNWTPDGQQETADSEPDIFTAVEEQLGLKLVPAKGPVDTVVVDRIERPSPN
jgi:uncharacterized protein (TIGR03435 family)